MLMLWKKKEHDKVSIRSLLYLSDQEIYLSLPMLRHAGAQWIPLRHVSLHRRYTPITHSRIHRIEFH